MPLKGKRNQPVSENVEQQPASTVPERNTKITQTPNQNSRRRPRRSSTYLPGIEGCLVPQICKDEGIKSLFRNLVRRFDSDDVVNLLLVELSVVNYWRISQGLKQEVRSLERGMGFDPQGTIPVVTRYVAAAQRSLDKSLQMLLQMQKEVESAEALETESAGAEIDGSAADSSTPSLPAPAPMNSDEPAPQESPFTDEEEWIDVRDLLPQSAYENDEAQADDIGDVWEEQPSTAPPTTSVATAQPAGDLRADRAEAEYTNLQTEAESKTAQTEAGQAEQPASATHKAGAEPAAAASQPGEGTAERPGETAGADLPAAA